MDFYLTCAQIVEDESNAPMIFTGKFTWMPGGKVTNNRTNAANIASPGVTFQTVHGLVF